MTVTIQNWRQTMRIKTSKETLETLPEVTKSLKFSSNAETLKLAIALTLNKYPDFKQLPDEEVNENGFEIDTHILFGDDAEYYFELVKFYINQENESKDLNVSKNHISTLIEFGYRELFRYYKLSKGDIVKFTKYIVELI